MIVIYHGPNCTDGWTAAWAVKKAHPNATLIPAQHGDESPDVTGEDVVIVDFAYPAAITLDMMRKSKSFLLLDHHKSAADDLLRNRDIQVVLANSEFGMREIQIIFDMTKSGAKLAWEHFHPGVECALVDYVSDADLWNWMLPNSKEINAYIRSHGHNESDWSRLEAEIGNPLFAYTKQHGESILRYQEQLIQEAVISARLVEIQPKRKGIFGWLVDFFLPLESYYVPATNAIGDFRSEVASRLAQDFPFAVCWRQLPDGRFAYSLRTHKDSPYKVDLTTVAKHFGGGGHPAAAAFTTERLIF